MNLFDAVTVARKVLYGGYEVSPIEKSRAYEVLAKWHPKIAAFEDAANKSNELIKDGDYDSEVENHPRNVL